MKFIKRLANALDAGSSLIEMVFALVMIIGTTSAARYTFWEAEPTRGEIVSATMLVIIAWAAIDAMFTLIGTAFQLGRERLAARQAGDPVPAIAFHPEAWWTVLASFVATSIAMWPTLIPFAFSIDDRLALWLSNAIAIAVLYWVGWFWARWTDFPRWLCGLVLAVVGLVAVSITLLLGVA